MTTEEGKNPLLATTRRSSENTIPPEHQAVLDRRLAPNGLAYREITCKRCGYHLGDDGILIGCYRKKCPRCKFPNEVEVNRVGEQEELEEHYARKKGG